MPLIFEGPQHTSSPVGSDASDAEDEDSSEDEVEQCSEFFPSFNETFPLIPRAFKSRTGVDKDVKVCHWLREEFSLDQKWGKVKKKAVSDKYAPRMIVDLLCLEKQTLEQAKAAAVAPDAVKAHCGIYLPRPAITRCNSLNRAMEAIDKQLKKGDDLDGLLSKLAGPRLQQPSEPKFIEDFCRSAVPSPESEPGQGWALAGSFAGKWFALASFDFDGFVNTVLPAWA
ncbi:hypothetical protein HPB47_006999 [Ixodes persulcatus]|uniref:Uncharacterized protein n=1 Tax=Ixodes persulcatus TaxID=34615 RepID=A0AC60P946_IXOPE|nr:hypothetical protein HPB47_006999 [Ixodes persulcatus]